MDFLQAIAFPVVGDHILGYLYADEQVYACNLCWALREHFVADIFDIRHGIAVWQHLLWVEWTEACRDSEVHRELMRVWRIRSGGCSSDEDSGSWG